MTDATAIVTFEHDLRELEPVLSEEEIAFNAWMERKLAEAHPDPLPAAAQTTEPKV